MYYGNRRRKSSYYHGVDEGSGGLSEVIDQLSVISESRVFQQTEENLGITREYMKDGEFVFQLATFVDPELGLAAIFKIINELNDSGLVSGVREFLPSSIETAKK